MKYEECESDPFRFNFIKSVSYKVQANVTENQDRCYNSNVLMVFLRITTMNYEDSSRPLSQVGFLRTGIIQEAVEVVSTKSSNKP